MDEPNNIRAEVVSKYRSGPNAIHYNSTVHNRDVPDVASCFKYATNIAAVHAPSSATVTCIDKKGDLVGSAMLSNSEAGFEIADTTQHSLQRVQTVKPWKP